MIEYILNQGVAIGMLVYFVARFEKILKDNTETLKILVNEVKGGRRK